MLHVRYDGKSVEFTFLEAGVTENMSDQEVRTQIARHLDTPLTKFDDYVVDRPGNGDMIVRPQAVYG